MKKISGLLLLMIASVYSCKKDVHTQPALPGSYITAKVNGVHMTFDSLASAHIDAGGDIIMSGFVGLAADDTPLFSGGYDQTRSDYIFLRLFYDYAEPIRAGVYTDTSTVNWLSFRYGKYLNTSFQPNYTFFTDNGKKKVAFVTVSSIADSVMEGTFEGNVNGDSDPSQELVITEGKFRVRMWQ